MHYTQLLYHFHNNLHSLKYDYPAGKVTDMLLCAITALGVGGATVFGSLLGLLMKNIPRYLNDVFLSLAAGIMLAAAILGLILPAVDNNSRYSLLLTNLGIFTGAVLLSAIDRMVPNLQRILGIESSNCADRIQLNRALLFLTAIAIHNFPEGLAAGVSFGCENAAEAFLISGGIALQNIPEGMVIIAPMLQAGISVRKTFLCALITGLIEVIGTFVGYITIRAGSSVLPPAMGFAGGTMLYMISDEMIPQTHSDEGDHLAAFALLAGFCLMLLADTLLQ